ncbi:MAG: hypothetical protein KAS32_25005 [Candidatus Peribacteraceae bacterium]|nr:hypothetical protein [Candidatus Peribacteraceae bacterium]
MNNAEDWIDTRDCVTASDHDLNQIKPLRDIILVRPDDFVEKLDSGLFIPKSTEEEQHHGVIVKTGPRLWKHGKLRALEVQLGDTVFFNRYDGWTIQVGGERLLVMRQQDIKAREVGGMIKPLKDKVIVKRVEEADKTDGGIIIPDAAKQQQEEGLVVAVGADSMDVSEGDRVLFGQHSGTDIDIKGVPHLVMNETNIFAVIG